MRARLMRWTVAALVAGGVGASMVGAAGAPDANLVAARAASQRMLSLTPLPSGAVSAPADPSVHGSLSQVYEARGPQQVILTQYWTVSGTPGSVSDYIYRHPPAGSHFYSSAGLGLPPLSSSGWQEERSFPDEIGRVTSELLEITTAPARDGGTAVRADAIVLWRPTWERVPVAARGARVRLDGFAQRTVTGSALGRLRAFVNTQPVVAPGVYSCPSGFPGQAIGVTFVDGRGRPLAHIAYDSADGCGWLAMSAAGRRGPALWDGFDLPARLWSAGSLTRCVAPQLRVSVSALSIASAQGSATLMVSNRARTPCTVKGALTIRLVTSAGARLNLGRTPMSGPAALATAPGRGRLSAQLLWPASHRRCERPVPTSAVIGVPGLRYRFDVTLRPSRHRFGPCSGRLGVTPLVGTT